MASKINADTSGGLKLISDTSGVIEFQSAGTTKAGVNGTGLTGDASQVTALNAAAVTSGTLPMARLSGTLPALNGSALTALAAGNIATGTVPTARLGSGTASSSTFLRGDSTYAVPGGGKVLQVKQVVKLDTATAATAYGSWADISGMSLAITPSASSSKILVMVNGSTSPSSNNYSIGINLVRGSTSIFIANSRSSATRTSDWGLCQSNQNNSVNIVYLDSPSTTGATTYKIQMASEQGNTALFGGSYSSGGASNGSVPGSIILMEIGA
jgi:hypothetical protein